MASRSSSSVNSRSSCHCGYPVVMKTSKTSKNPGRRFIGCRNWRSETSCGFFDWIDTNSTQSNLEISNEYLKKEIEDLKKVNGDLKKVNDDLKKDIENVKNDKVKCKIYFLLVALLFV
ncbi:hypothetical protein LguiA_021595 [Lonicera macranthoides]